MSEPVRFGILSTAKIGRKAVGPALLACDDTELVAVGSRDADRARRFADDLGIPEAHGSYEALLDDPRVEAVYIPLPNSMHESWTLRALEAGKHVLCEKPLAPTEAACLRMGAAAQEAGLVLMEAFMYRFHPRVLAAVEAVREGRLGRPAFVDSEFTTRLRDPANIRFSTELAGGALLDVGCYAVDVALRLLGEEPVSVSAAARFDRGNGVDLETAGVLRFPSGAIASVRCAFTLARRETVEVRGDEGSLSFDHAFVPGDGETELRFEGGPGESTVERIEGRNPYVAMVEAFAARVRGRPLPGLPASDAGEAAATVRVLEAMLARASGSDRERGGESQGS